MLLKAFRLFVSSTFADFVQERDVLQNAVFPALDAYCLAKGYQFYAIDMRWGINEEAQLDQRTAEICLGEVRAAKNYPPPNFLIMIGNRYGWVPLPYAIARDEFDAVVSWLEGLSQNAAVRSLRSVYQLDDNHLVPRGLAEHAPDTETLVGAYTLRSRDNDLPELKPAEAWARLEVQVRRALQDAAAQLLKLGRIRPEGNQKYFISVTEQEIARGLLDGTDAIALIRHLAAATDDASAPARRLLGLFRRSQPPPSVRNWPPAGFVEIEPRLEQLKSRIGHDVPIENIVTAQATLAENGKVDPTYLASFASAIQRKLEAAIDRHIAQVSVIEQSPDFALESERAEQRAFAEQKRKIFIGRDSNLATIESYIVDDAARPLVLHGRSGYGKSALMARAIADAEAVQSVPVVYRFIGATAASSDIRSLLVSLVEELAARGIANNPHEMEDDTNRFVEQIKGVLSSITKPVVIFLDALDQLQKPYRIGWLPDKLPTAVKLVLSVLNDQDYATDSGLYRGLRRRLQANSFVEIEPLGTLQSRDILAALEQANRRRLQGSQRDYIIAQFEKAGASPLFLKTAFEIARGWRSTDKVGEGHNVLAETTTALIAQFLRDLSAVHHHAPELVSRTLGYLAAAKEGLSAKELTEILARDSLVMQAISSEKHGARTNMLPASVWVRLNHQLAPFTVEKRIDDQPLLHFFHRQVANVAREQHYETSKVTLHGSLANYFDARAVRENGGIVYDKRSLSELPYQLHSAGNRRRLDEILMSPDWMRQKLAAFGPQALVADYEQFGRGSMQILIGRTLRLCSGICARDQRQLLPQLIGRLLSSPEPAIQDFLKRARRLLGNSTLVPNRPALTPPGAEIARFEGHTDEVKTIAVLPDNRLASGSADTTIRLWDIATVTETLRLEGHTGEIRSIVALADGRLASGSADNTIRLWDGATGAEIAHLKGHESPVNAIAVLHDGRLASGSDDRTIRLWDVAACTEHARLLGHGGSVNALAVTSNGGLASGSSDRTIRLWDVKVGTEKARFERSGGEVMELALGGVPIGGVLALAAVAEDRLASGWDSLIRQWDLKRSAETGSPMSHQNLVRALAVLPDGRLASGSDDRTIRFWDAKTGTETANLAGHGGPVNGLAVLADGRLASCSSDHTIRLWDTGASTANAHVASNGDPVNALAMLPDGRLASGSGTHWGGTIKLWDAKSGSEMVQLKVSGGEVTALAVLADGRLASASRGRVIDLWDIKRGVWTGELQYLDSGANALAVLPDGRLASASSDRIIRVWDVNSRIETARLEGHDGPVNVLTLSAEGHLVSGSDDGTIRIWDEKAGAEIARVDLGGGPIITMAVLADGRLAAGCADSTIRLWDVKAGVVSARLVGHEGRVMALAVMSDGRLASGSDDRTARLWDIATDAELSRLEFDGSVSSLMAHQERQIIVGDRLGRLNWLEIVDCS